MDEAVTHPSHGAPFQTAMLLLEVVRELFHRFTNDLQTADKRTLQRHRLIYGALGQRIGGDIHALSIQAYTPDEWSVRQA